MIFNMSNLIVNFKSGMSTQLLICNKSDPMDVNDQPATQKNQLSRICLFLIILDKMVAYLPHLLSQVFLED